MKIDPHAFSKDGFLEDQDYLSNFPYGCYLTLLDGCGWIVIYNAECVAGRGIAVETVYEAICRILPYGGTHGTPFLTVVRYSKEKHIPVARIYGSGEGLVCIIWESATPYDILHYIEGGEPHYIAFVRISGETPARYRLLNTVGDKKDFVKTMECFRREHLGGRQVVRFLLPGEEREDVRAHRKNHIVDTK